jgi:hypothetical protein
MISSSVPYQLFRFLALSTCILVLPLSAIAQSQPAPGVGTPGCGPADMRFEVTTSKIRIRRARRTGESVDLFFAGRHALQLTAATLDFSGSGWAMDRRN